MTAVVGVVCCVGLGSAGCARSDAVTQGPPAGDPVRVLRSAAEALVDAGSSQTRTSLEMATGGTRVTIRGEGVYDYRRRLGRLKVLLPRTPRAPPTADPSPNCSRPGRCT